MKEYEDGYKKQATEIQGSSQLQDDKFGKKYTKMYNKLVAQLRILEDTKAPAYRLMMRQVNDACRCVDSFLPSFMSNLCQ